MSKYYFTPVTCHMPMAGQSRFRTQADADRVAMIVGGYKSVPVTLPNGRTVMRDVPDTRFIDQTVTAHERRISEYLHIPIPHMHQNPDVLKKNRARILAECKYVDVRAYRAVLRRAQHLATFERPQNIGENPFE